MQLKRLIVLVFLSGLCRAEQLKTTFNPFTGKLDYITALSTQSIQAGSNVTVSTTAQGVIISASTGSSSGVTLLDTGVAFGSASNTVTSDTGSFTFDDAHQSLTIYNTQPNPGFGALFPNLELKKASGNFNCQFWDDDGSTSGYGLCQDNANFNISRVTNIGLVTSVAHYVDFDTNGGFPIGSTMTVNVPINFFNATMTSGFFQLFSQTKAQITALTPAAVGQLYQCSDCATVPVCISTGTAVGSFSLITNKTAVCQ